MPDLYFPAVDVAGAQTAHEGFALLAAAKTWAVCQLVIEACAPAVMPEQADLVSELVELVETIPDDFGRNPVFRRQVVDGSGFRASVTIRRETRA